MSIDSAEIITSTPISINPDPQILHVLTFLEMKPIDSLCELIDNSIDALQMGASTPGGMVMITLPTRKEIDDGRGLIRLRDNGPGMTLQQVESSLRAGYSSKSKYGTLGLFGVGFNIATGKLGRTTKVTTARSEDDYAIQVTLDLIKLKRSGGFSLTAHRIEKPSALKHGTLIEISDPWGPGVQNYGYMLKLISLGRPTILNDLGRVYASILRDKKLRIIVGEDTVEAFNHCVWDDARYVERQKHGKIHAVYRFKNKVIHSYLKCAECGTPIPQGSDSQCPDRDCGSSATVTQEERISGWVGIQRYLDANHYGIDLIRHGRAIRILEQEVFFKFVDPDTRAQPIVDYPIDNRDGRIVGEIHLDHVPVDPAKQNFERSSPEWHRAIEFLRGRSSLQPEQPGAQHNTSPIFKLYQGYRKVRTPGRQSMTMGRWLPGATDPVALSKDEIEELKKKFLAKEPGYFEDTEWWKLVEAADDKPVPGLRSCPECFVESQEGLDECPNCSHIFEGKHCIDKSCAQLISRSAVTCQYCGANQIPEVREPWVCEVCRNYNSSEDSVCGICHSTRGTLNPVSETALRAAAHFNESLSIKGMTVGLASGAQSSPTDVNVYTTEKGIYACRSDGKRPRLPCVKFTQNEITIYIDPSHPLFGQAGTALEQQVAFEAAAFVYEYHKSVTTSNPAEHTITKIATDILEKYWPEKFSTAAVVAELEALFALIKEKLVDAATDEGDEIYANLPADEKNKVVSELIRAGRDAAELAQLKQNAQFIKFLGPRGPLEIFKFNPKLFFDGNVWDITYDKISDMHHEGRELAQSQLRNIRGSLLEIATVYLEKGTGDRWEAELAKAACKLLSAKLAG